MSSYRTPLRALTFLCGLSALGCQTNDDPATGPSGPVLGAGQGGCDVATIYNASFVKPNSLKATLSGLCGDAEKLVDQGKTNEAGVKVGQAFHLIDDNFENWTATNQQVVDYIHAFCGLVDNEFCPSELTAATLGNFEASCTTGPSSILVTDNGRFAVFVLWSHAQHPTTCSFAAQAPHSPDWTGDCTGFVGNSRKDCQNEAPYQTGFWPQGAAVIFPQTVAGTPDASIVELCEVLSGGIEIFGESETTPGVQPTVPFGNQVIGVPDAALVCSQSAAVPGGLPGLVWNVTQPLRSLFDASPAYAGGGRSSYAFSGTVYQGTSPNDRQCSCSGKVTGQFDSGSEGVIVKMTLDTPGYPETGTIVDTTVTDGEGDYTVGGVCPDELDNDYTLEFAKTEGNQSHRATKSDICVDLSAEFPTKTGLETILLPGVNN